MKKVLLSHDQLEQVINLREKGLSWVKIEKEKGIARRIAKREYDQWLAKKSQRQLEDARKEVGIQEYRLHLALLSRMAEFLLDSLVIPDPLTDLRKANEVIAQFLKTDPYQDQSEFESQLGNRQGNERLVRMNELLFKSLRDHTEGKVPWQSLDVWKGSRDSCVEDIEKMRDEIDEVFNNYIEQEPKIKEKLGKRYANLGVTEDIKKGILTNIWLNDVTGKGSQITAMRGVSLINKGSSWVTFNDNTSGGIKVTFDQDSPSDNELLTKEVVKVSKKVISNLRIKGDLIQRAKEEVHKMRESASRLEATLNPLVLRPVILNTRCDICPI